MNASSLMSPQSADFEKVIFWISHETHTHPHDMTWFSANIIYFILAFMMGAKFLEEVVFPRCIPKYEEYSIRSVRNLVTYVLEVVVTSYCFYLTASHGLRVYMEKHNQNDIVMARMSLAILCSLYLFELVYRLEMNFQLTFHHILTLLLCILGVQGAYDTRDCKYVAAGTLLALTATTEQFSFIALFMYRIKHKFAGFALRAAALQTFLFKALLTYLLVEDVVSVIYGPHANNPNGTMWYQYWKILLVVLVPGLFFTQIYGAWVMWKIGSSRRLCDSPRKDKKEMGEECKSEQINNKDVPPIRHLKHA